MSSTRFLKSAPLQSRAAQQLRIHGHDDRAQRHEDSANGQAGRRPTVPAPRQQAGSRRCGRRRPTTSSESSCGTWLGSSAMIRGTSRGSLRTSTTSPASTATSVPAPNGDADIRGQEPAGTVPALLGHRRHHEARSCHTRTRARWLHGSEIDCEVCSNRARTAGERSAITHSPRP